MNLTVKNIEDIMEAYAPTELKESYDNVGLMVGDSESEINSILVALDCTIKVIEEAKRKGCNLIVTHHPILFLKPASITMNTLLGKKLISLIKNDISVYSSHTNLDIAKGGLNDILTELLGYKNSKVIENISSKNPAFRGLGIGRIVDLPEPILLEKLINNIKAILDIDCVKYCGDDSKIISKIAIINGSGEDYFKSAKKMGADCIITGDTSYHYVSDFEEEDMAIIDAGHFNTEWPAMKIVGILLERKIKSLGFENKVYISEASRNPYKCK